jgi:hypothetical protein
MSPKLRDSALFKSIGISLLLNCGLALSAFLSDARWPPLVLLRRVADAVAAPPGLIIGTFGPKQHTQSAFLWAVAEALLCSIAFYAIIFFGVLRLVAYWRSGAAQRRKAGGLSA